MPVQGVSTRGTVTVKTEDPAGRVLEGAFTFRRRTVADNGRIMAVMSRLTGGQPIVDEGLGVALRAQAELEVVIEEAPEWWTPELLDNETLLAVYVNFYLPWRDTFRGRKQAGAENGRGQPVAAPAGPREHREGLAPAVVGT